MRIVLLALVFAVGCKPSRDCDRAIANPSVAVAGDKPAKITVAMRAHCKADHWGDDVLACYGDAKDDASRLAGCIDKLTGEQQDKLMADLAPIISDAPGSRGSAGSGSGGAR